MVDPGRVARREAVAEHKRTLILQAALQIFAADGLEGANVRAIAKAAGYTPGAIYAYFPSKEHIYAAALEESLDRLTAATTGQAARARSPEEKFTAAGLAFFDFYDTHPRDLDLGFYLFRGGIRPHGLSQDLDIVLNTKLLAALQPIHDAAIATGLLQDQARTLTADVLAHASGLLLLAHTRRLALFDLHARTLMQTHLHALLTTRPVAAYADSDGADAPKRT